MPEPQHNLRLSDVLWGDVQREAARHGLTANNWLRRWLPIAVALSKLTPATPKKRVK